MQQSRRQRTCIGRRTPMNASTPAMSTMDCMVATPPAEKSSLLTWVYLARHMFQPLPLTPPKPATQLCPSQDSHLLMVYGSSTEASKTMSSAR